MPAQNGTSPRGMGRVRARTEDTVQGRYLAANISGTNARIPACRPLSSTGISRISPWVRCGQVAANSSETFAPSDIPPMTARSAPRWSSSASTWSANDETE